MVFLFIAFLATIFIFSAPISVKFSLFSAGIKKKPKITVEIFNFINYPRKKVNNDKEKNQKKKIKIPFKLKVNKDDVVGILKKFLPSNFLLEIKLPNNAPAHIVFPIMGVLAAINDVMESFGKSARLSIAYGGEDIYYQSKVQIKFNLFMIFSAFFQIIRIEYKGR